MTSPDRVSTSVFTPQAVASINRAYSEALAVLAREKSAGDLRVRLAERMMVLARTGEVDEQRLCRQSVAAILGRWPGPPAAHGSRLEPDREAQRESAPQRMEP